VREPGEDHGTKEVNPRPKEDTAEKKRIETKMKILSQTWAQLMKLMPKTYTKERWTELWKEYESPVMRKDYPTQESRIDDMTKMLNVDLQEAMKNKKAKGETK